jgi:hypothetical protein
MHTDNHALEYKQIPSVTDTNSLAFAKAPHYSVQSPRIGEMKHSLMHSDIRTELRAVLICERCSNPYSICGKGGEVTAHAGTKYLTSFSVLGIAFC